MNNRLNVIKIFCLFLAIFIAGCGGSGSSSSGGGAGSVSSSGGTGLDSSHPNVVVRVSKSFYDVFGSSISQLRSELRSKGPGSFFARTISTIAYQYRTTGNCSVQNATITVTSNLLLPRWTARGGASSGTVSQWNRFETALERHELNHARFAIAEAEQFARIILGMSAPGCAALDAAIDQAHKNSLARLTARDEDYDDRTGHGSSEGARL